MWGEPREGTEAYLVKKQAERRRKIATDKGLDKLLVDVYDDILKYYPAWISKVQTKKWVHPMVSNAKESGEKYSPDIEFVFENKAYKITRDRGWRPEFGEGTWYELTLYLNEAKVFEVTEEETSDEYGTYHRPISISAYLNDEWVADFKSIKSHKEKVSVQSAIEFAEDPERTRKLKEDFGIADLSEDNSMINGIASSIEKRSKKSIWSKWWVWIIIVVIILILLNQ